MSLKLCKTQQKVPTADGTIYAGKGVVEAVAVGYKKHQSSTLTEPWCPTVRPVQTGDRSSIIELWAWPRGRTIAAVCRSLWSILTAGR